jgi:hypothetical protein
MKATLLTLFTICALIITGCTTPVAIDPMTGQEQAATFRAGYFYAPVSAPIGQVFKSTIRELDGMGYFRTGELHKKKYIKIYGRKIGDEKVTVRITQLAEGQCELRIRVGNFGDLPESQIIYARIRDAL